MAQGRAQGQRSCDIRGLVPEARQEGGHLSGARVGDDGPEGGSQPQLLPRPLSSTQTQPPGERHQITEITFLLQALK